MSHRAPMTWKDWRAWPCECMHDDVTHKAMLHMMMLRSWCWCLQWKWYWWWSWWTAIVLCQTHIGACSEFICEQSCRFVTLRVGPNLKTYKENKVNWSPCLANDGKEQREDKRGMLHNKTVRCSKYGSEHAGNRKEMTEWHIQSKGEKQEWSVV